MDPDIAKLIVNYCWIFTFACFVALALCGWQAAVVWVLGMASVAVIAKILAKLDA